MHTRTELAASCSQKKKKEKEPGQWNLRIEGEGKRTDTQHIAVLRLSASLCVHSAPAIDPQARKVLRAS